MLDLARFNNIPAIIWRDHVTSYTQLHRHYETAQARLKGIPFGTVVLLHTRDASPNAVAYLLALWDRKCIVVPCIGDPVKMKKIAQVEATVMIAAADGVAIFVSDNVASHPLYEQLRRKNAPGLVLFSSGSSGEPKAAVHDVNLLMDKFKTNGRQQRMLSFLLFDHIGGLNTLLYCLSNGGTLVIPANRVPTRILKLMVETRVQVLPTTPTFLNMLLLGGDVGDYNLSCLEMITYGTEPMPAVTLEAMSKLLPRVRFKQTYGLSELGIMPSKSKDRDSTWMKLGGEGFKTRMRDGLLEIKAQSAMLGYLNAPSPFTEDGWFKTGDVVEVDGEWMRILGRKTDIINIGGEKVYPAEVEALLMGMPGVLSATVTGEPHPLMGNLVKAKVQLGKSDETLDGFRARLLKTWGDKPYKMPQKIELVQEEQVSPRFKKARS